MADQLPLLLRDEAHAPATARGVFALPYLRRHLAGLAHTPGKEATDTLHEFAHALWEKNHIGLSKGNEAYTRTHSAWSNSNGATASRARKMRNCARSSTV